MSFKVVWKHSAIRSLAGLFATAMETGLDGDEITSAVTRIDQLLQTNPMNRGESRADQERVLFESPLAINFEVHEEEQVVLVLSTRYYRRKSS